MGDVQALHELFILFSFCLVDIRWQRKVGKGIHTHCWTGAGYTMYILFAFNI